MAQFSLMNLPFAKDSMPGLFTPETFDFHHGKHHNAYVVKLNELLPGSGFENATLDEIVLKSSGPIFNQAAQIWNHDFYWHSLTPQTGTTPEGELKKMIEATWGTFENFKAEFEKAALSLFGSGWVWLAFDTTNSRLAITQTKDAENPMRQGMKPLLTLDVWEHAYYINYRNARAEYVKKWWNHVNWKFAEGRLQA